MWIGLCVSFVLTNNAAGQATSVPNDSATTLEDIYRIEMVVFANNNSYTDEQWPARPVLNYPSRLLFLGETPIAGTVLTEHADEPAHITDTAEKVDAEPSHSVASNSVNLPALLRKLPPDERVLNESAAALDRRKAYRVLFHEAWLQQLESPENAAALVVNGGSSYGNHFALEGSVKFSKKRFLHINSNLWLNDFDTLPHNSGQDEWQHYYADAIMLPLVPTAPLVRPDNNVDISDNAGMLQAANPKNSPAHIFTQNKQANVQNNFIVKHVYTMKEYRRLKRNEVHYLDHPRFGLIVTISKYEPKLEDSE